MERFNHGQFWKTLGLVLGVGMPTIGVGLPILLNNVMHAQIQRGREEASRESELNNVQNPVDIPDAPVYQISENRCAQYVRLAAKDLFGKNFRAVNAWDRRYEDELVSSVDRPLNEYVQSGILKPGMIVGTYNPESSFLSHLDGKGLKVKYTHNVLYLGGKDKNGNGVLEGKEVYFAHQYGNRIESKNLDELISMGLTPMEIIDSRN